METGRTVLTGRPSRHRASPVENGPCKRYGRSVPTIRKAGADYEAEETLLLTEPALIRILVDDTRTAICALLRERAYSIQQLARELEIPKGTVGHHVKTLEEAGLVHVVRTRQVRAITEKFYGRTAWTFLVQAEEEEDDQSFAAAGLRRAASELREAEHLFTFGVVRSRLTPVDQRRFERRLHRLLRDFNSAEADEGEPCILAGAMYSNPQHV